MSSSAIVPTPEELAILDQVIRQVARTTNLSADDAQDFSQLIQLRLLEQNYAIFRQFGGRSSLKTYLTVVVRRMLLDWRNAVQGKWRASAAASRLGQHAVALERLIYRDGYSPAEAVEILRSRGCAVASGELLDLSARVPTRQVRRTVSDENLADHGAPFEDPIDAAERRRIRRHVRVTLAIALRQLPPQDRWLIRARYQRRQSLQDVAATLSVDPKILYRRLGKALRSLRRALASAGVHESHVH